MLRDLADAWSRITLYAAGLLLVAVVLLVGAGWLGARWPDQTADAEWLPIERTLPAFTLESPDLGPMQHSARRHRTGGGREDVLRFGDPAMPTLEIILYRGGREHEGFGPAGVELRRAAPRLGDLTVGARAGVLDTKFGTVTLVEATIGSGSDTRPCVGFVRAFVPERFQIIGRACNPAGEIVDRAQLACRLDRIQLMATGPGDELLSARFAGFEQDRRFCGADRLGAATPRIATWVEARRLPRLRGTFERDE